MGPKLIHMRPIITAFACLWLACAAGGARAQDKPLPAKPSDSMIIGMAQQFVLEHFKRRPEDHFDVAFDIANIHPQPEGGYWAVVGGFMADAGNKNYLPHAYGVAIRLICSDHDKLKCWQLEKLVIDRKIILNN
jgi:hypothetical protein